MTNYNNNKPLVSVIMSVRNCEEFLKKCIISILSQSYKNIEFIIVNDASSDGTKTIINSFKEKRVKIISNKRRLGLTNSLNKALGIAKGKYIARMDGDDIAFKNRIRDQVNYMEKHKKVGVVGSWVKIIDQNNKIIGNLKFPVSNKSIKKYIFTSNPFRHSTVLIRKSLFELYGNYDKLLDGAEDYDLWLRFARFTKFANIPSYLLYYRFHTNQVSNKSESKVLISAIKSRVKAIFLYRYSITNFIYLLIPIIGLIIPKIIKTKFSKSYLYK